MFKAYDPNRLSQPIAAFTAGLAKSDLNAICEGVYQKMLAALNTHYAGKYLAVLFKNPTMSKHVFELAT